MRRDFSNVSGRAKQQKKGKRVTLRVTLDRQSKNEAFKMTDKNLIIDFI